MKKVLLTAEHHNWGCHTIYDWHQTKYILYEDGTLLSVVFEGGAISSHETILSKEDTTYIKRNIKKFIHETPEIEADDGSAWQFEGPDYEFSLGYIYGSKLEKIAEILIHKG